MSKKQKAIVFSLISILISLIAVYTENMVLVYVSFVFLIISSYLLIFSDDKEYKTNYPTICDNCNKMISGK